MKRIDPIERFEEWAIDAPIDEVRGMCSRLASVVKIRERYSLQQVQGLHSSMAAPEPRRGRPKGSRNRPKEQQAESGGTAA